MGRKKGCSSKPYQRRATGATGFACLYYDLLDSAAFHDLAPRQKVLYVYCVRESHGRAMRDSASMDESLFYMNAGLRSKYHELYSPNDTRCFERDMSALIMHGFIDCLQSNFKSREKNVYCLSSRWHKWGTDAFEVPDSVMTNHMKIERGRKPE